MGVFKQQQVMQADACPWVTSPGKGTEGNGYCLSETEAEAWSWDSKRQSRGPQWSPELGQFVSGILGRVQFNLQRERMHGLS